MLTINQYNLKYPKEDNKSYIQNPIYPGCVFIAEGMLEFTKESASSWGGPFEGNYAQFLISDYTNATIQSGKNKGKNLLKYYDELRKEFEEKVKRGFYEYKAYKASDSIITKYQSSSYPIRFYIFGNDDTSYSKYYKSKQEALYELNLFISNEPLEFKTIIDFDFHFTN